MKTGEEPPAEETTGRGSQVGEAMPQSTASALGANGGGMNLKVKSDCRQGQVPWNVSKWEGVSVSSPDMRSHRRFIHLGGNIGFIFLKNHPSGNWSAERDESGAGEEVALAPESKAMVAYTLGMAVEMASSGIEFTL